MRVVISQPMYFPWLGQLNQALLADVFVFYSDIQFARGFINRVQLLIGDIQQFITVPTVGSKRSLINQLVPDSSQDWQQRHSAKLYQSLGNSLYWDIANSLFAEVVNSSHDNLAALSSQSVIRICKEVFPHKCPLFYDSTQFPRVSSSTQALVDICKELGASHYLTGLGAKNYIDQQLFINEGIELEFIDYHIGHYSQNVSNCFTPYVSSLDAIARIGSKNSCNMLKSKIIPASQILS